MKQIFSIIAALALTAGLFLPRQASAQTPQRMSYQAVIRNSSNALVTNHTVGMRISILQGSAGGAVVYTETQTPTTNASGLVSIEIGDGMGFSAIDWANGTYFIKTETDPAGGTDYTITGISQLMSVPYAFHAKTAESLSGDITETDPMFTAWDKSTGISITESQVSDLGSYVETETDPVFGASVANGITATDTANWNNKLESFSETDPMFTVWDKSTGISITKSQVSDLGNYLENETDPVFGSSMAKRITATDTANWNNKLSSYSETDPSFTAWDKSTGISITKSQVSDLGSYVETETDPVFDSSVAKGITAADTANWNNKLGSYTETDPVFAGTFNISNPQDNDLLKYDTVTQKWVSFTPNYAGATHIHSNTTDTTDGFMSATDKTRLEGLTNANGSETKLTVGSGVIITGAGTSANPYVITATPPASPTYSIGLNAALGGYVFYVSADKKHGLVAQTKDMLFGAEISHDHAVRLVSDPSAYAYVGDGGENFADWRLPTCQELELMFKKQAELGLKTNVYYWSPGMSFHQGVGYYHIYWWAYKYYSDTYSYGVSDEVDSDANGCVRAVRTF